MLSAGSMSLLTWEVVAVAIVVIEFVAAGPQ
jgi:hypothetical protein